MAVFGSKNLINRFAMDCNIIVKYYTNVILTRMMLLMWIILSINFCQAQIANFVVPTGHTSNIKKTIISADKKYAYMVSEDLVTMWEFRQQKQMYSIRHGLTFGSLLCELSPDGNYIAVADLSNLFVFSTINGKQLLKASEGGAQALMFSADSKTLYYEGRTKNENGTGLYFGIIALDINTGKERAVFECSVDSRGKTCPFGTFNFSALGNNKVYLPNITKQGWDILDLSTKQVVLAKPQSYRTLDNFNDSVDKTFRPIPNTNLLLSKEKTKGIFYPSLTYYDAFSGKMLCRIDLEFGNYEITYGCDGKTFVITYDDETIAPKQYALGDIQNGVVKPKALKWGQPIYEECKLRNKQTVYEIDGTYAYNDTTQRLFLVNDSLEKKEIDLARMVSISQGKTKAQKGSLSVCVALSKSGKWLLNYENYVDAKGNGLDRLQLYNTANNISRKLVTPFEPTDVHNSSFFSKDEASLYTAIRDFENSGTLYRIDLITLQPKPIKKYKGLVAVNVLHEYAVSSFDNKISIFDIKNGKDIIINAALPENYRFMWGDETSKWGDTIYLKNSSWVVGYNCKTGERVITNWSDLKLNNYQGYDKIFPYSHVVDSISMVMEGKIIMEYRSMIFSQDKRLIYAFGHDNSIGVFDAKTGHYYGKLYLFENSNDWVFIDPEGRFDGTPDGMKQLYYLKERNIIPLDLVFEKYYTPNLYQRLLAGEKFNPIPDFEINPKPVAKILYAESKRNLEVEEGVPAYVNTTGIAEITVSAIAPEDKVDEIRLFHNGKAVNLATRGLFVTDNDGSDSKKYTIHLLPGYNSFRAIALNSQRTESEPDEISVRYGKEDGVPTPTPNNNDVANIDLVDKNATLHLIVVGVNAYKGKINPLGYAVPDATAFKEELERDAKSIIAAVKSYFITDAKADRNGIIHAFDEIVKSAKPQDVFVFYYAGHGYIHPDKKEFYLVSADVEDGNASLLKNGIPSKELQQYAVNIPAQKQLFILDACQSAGAFEKMLQHDGEQQKALAVVARSTGTHWMAASGSTETAKEFGELGHGVFTYSLLEALKGKAVKNRMITVNGLKDFLQVKVPELIKRYGGDSQYPASYGFGKDFPVELVK